MTVEATEDVTTEAVAPHAASVASRPGADRGDGTPGRGARRRCWACRSSRCRCPASPPRRCTATDDARQIDYDEEITVLAAGAGDPLGRTSTLVRLSWPSITDDDEEETKVEPAETAMKAAESIDDVTTALSAQASLEREKALRRSAPAHVGPASDDLEFADPEADDE